jgi:hypothetical protein
VVFGSFQTLIPPKFSDLNRREALIFFFCILTLHGGPLYMEGHFTFTWRAQMGAGPNRPRFLPIGLLGIVKMGQGLYIGAQPKFLHISHGSLHGANLALKLWA